MYEVLSRRHRPKSLDDLIGNKLIVQVIRSSFRSNRLGHAFFLTGKKGVGKTTLSRILASCFNCEKGLSDQPCGSCQSCTLIEKDQHPDVFEIDAASRNKVEDVHELLENIHIKPVMGRFSVFIMDEVHMFSASAFAAMLKTLEEPPSHVKFILATTEHHKVPETILSRCQCFQMRQLSPEEIVQGLEAVMSKDGLELDAQVMHLVAQACHGSMRDALSMLESLVSVGQNISIEDAHQLLGYGAPEMVYKIFMAAMSGNITKSLQGLESLLHYQEDVIVKQLLEAAHSACLAKLLTEEQAGQPQGQPHSTLSHVYDSPIYSYFLQSQDELKKITCEQLFHTWHLLIDCMHEITVYSSKGHVLRMLLMRMCMHCQRFSYMHKLLDNDTQQISELFSEMIGQDKQLSITVHHKSDTSKSDTSTSDTSTSDTSTSDTRTDTINNGSPQKRH